MVNGAENTLTTHQMARIVSVRTGVPYLTVLEMYKISTDLACEALINGRHVSFMGLTGLHTRQRRYWIPGTTERHVTQAIGVRPAIKLKRALRIINKKDAPGGASEDVSGGDVSPE